MTIGRTCDALRKRERTAFLKTPAKLGNNLRMNWNGFWDFNSSRFEAHGISSIGNFSKNAYLSS
jgi:hypothetical protein